MEFRESLIKRGEMTTYTDFDLKVFERAVDILNAYLSGDKPDMTDMDARIYHNYLQEHHSHFMKIAQEIDDEYQA
jgi:hypothetical protein